MLNVRRNMGAIGKIWLFSVFALACSGEEPNPDGPGDTDVQNRTISEGDCDKDFEGWTTEGNYTELTVSGDGFSLTPITTQVLHSQEDLDAFTAEHGVTIQGADFALTSILVASAGASSTCEMSDGVTEVLFLNPEVNGSGEEMSRGGIHLNFEMTDYSGTCDSVCDMFWYEVVAIAVPGPHTDPFEKDYSVCVKLHETCS